MVIVNRSKTIKDYLLRCGVYLKKIVYAEHDLEVYFTILLHNNYVIIAQYPQYHNTKLNDLLCHVIYQIEGHNEYKTNKVQKKSL